MGEIESIKLPSILWKIIVSLAALSLLLLTSFFSWLGITAVNHSREMSRQGSKLETIENIVHEIDEKIDGLPPKSVLEMPILIQALQQDATNRENQLDALERRVDVLEKISN